MPAYIGLLKKADDCRSNDLECRRQRWSWEDGTPYEYTVFHHWNDYEGGQNKYYGNPLFLEPQTGMLCTRMIAGDWFGVPCHQKYHCACKKNLHTKRKPARE